MTEIQDYLDERRQSAADIRTAEIVRRVDAVYYEVRDIRTQGLFLASKLNREAEYTVGTWVKIVASGASGLTQGGGYVILCPAEAEQRGQTGAAASDQTTFLEPVILNMIPDPAEITIGETTPVQVDIYGIGLTEAPEYSTGDIVDDSAPVITDEQITLQLVAPSGTEGEYDLTIHGHTFERSLRLRPVTPVPFDAVWAMNDAGDLFKINGSTLAIITSFSPAVPDGHVGLAADATKIYARGWDRLQRIDRATDTRDFDNDVTGTAEYASGSRLVLNAGTLQCPTDAGRIVTTDLNGNGESFEALPTAHAIADIIILGGQRYVLQGTTPNVVRRDDGGGSWTTLPINFGANWVTGDATDLYISTANVRVVKVDRASFTQVAFCDLGNSTRGVLMSGGYIYALTVSTVNGSQLHRIDPATMTELDSVVLTIGAGAGTEMVEEMTEINGTGYALSRLGTIFRIDLPTLTIEQSAGALIGAAVYAPIIAL
jgi:hypothetical protein